MVCAFVSLAENICMMNDQGPFYDPRKEPSTSILQGLPSFLITWTPSKLILFLKYPLGFRFRSNVQWNRTVNVIYGNILACFFSMQDIGFVVITITAIFIYWISLPAVSSRKVGFICSLIVKHSLRYLWKFPHFAASEIAHRVVFLYCQCICLSCFTSL